MKSWRLPALIILAIVLVSLPLTLFSVRQRQELRKEASTPPASQVSLSVIPASQSINPGGQPTVDVVMNSLSHEVSGIKFRLLYDSNVFSNPQVNIGQVFDSQLKFGGAVLGNGYVEVALARSPGTIPFKLGLATVATITFDSSPSAFGTTQLTFDLPNTQIFDIHTVNILGITNPGALTFGGGQITTTPALSPTPTTRPDNPIYWDTGYVTLQADDFYIIADGQYYFANNGTVQVRSDPGNRTYTTLEAAWQENNKEMRIFIYFNANQSDWWAYEIRTYNGQDYGDWINYLDQAPFFTSPLWTSHTASSYNLQSDPSNQYSGEIYFKNLDILAFANLPPLGSFHLLPPPGTQISFPVSTPTTGYGIGALLYDDQGSVVTNQELFEYQWQVDNPDIVSIQVGEHCVQGIQPPCPLAHGDLKGLVPGNTTIKVDVTYLPTGEIIASTWWDVTVTGTPPTSDTITITQATLEPVVQWLGVFTLTVTAVSDQSPEAQLTLKNLRAWPLLPFGDDFFMHYRPDSQDYFVERWIFTQPQSVTVVSDLGGSATAPIPTYPGVTPTPIPSPSPTPTLAVPAAGPINFTIEFRGIDQERDDQLVRVTLDRGGDQQVFTDVLVTSNSNGIYSGYIANPSVPAGSDYAIFIKGPKHLQKKFCSDGQTTRCTTRGQISLSQGQNTFDFSQDPLEPGDLPDPLLEWQQDGVVNAHDGSLLVDRLFSSEPDDLKVADLNLDGIVNAHDYSLLVETLSTKWEEDR
jgi:hypothetical protein